MGYTLYDKAYFNYLSESSVDMQEFIDEFPKMEYANFLNLTAGILSDIDIEIKMCDKYLKAAEDKDDLVAVREIMKTKRDLERQRARILYNKNYIFKGKKQYDMPDKYRKKNNDDD